MYTKELQDMSKEDIIAEVKILFNDGAFISYIEKARTSGVSQNAMWQHLESRRALYGAAPRFASQAGFNMFKSRLRRKTAV